MYWSLRVPHITVKELWDAIQKHRNTLESLDVFYDASSDESYAATEHFGPLGPFHRLRRLETQIDILLGDPIRGRRAPFRLRDTVPRSLEKLVLHMHRNPGRDHGFYIPELQEVVKEREHDCSLKLLTLCDDSAARWYRTRKFAEDTTDHELLDSQSTEPYSGLSSLCKKEIQLHVTAGCRNVYGVMTPARECELHRGGSCKWLWRRTWGIRLVGILRSDYHLELIPKAGLPNPDQHPWNDQVTPKKVNSDPIQIVPFTDHRGKEAFMVFSHEMDVQLPPLYPFVLYFTYPSATLTLESTDAIGLYKAIRDAMQHEHSHFRLDVYFLAGADEDACKAHYIAARNTRPDYKALLREFRDRISNGDFSHPPNRLPGMVHPDPSGEDYQTMFLMCHEPDWHEGAQRISIHLSDKPAIPVRREDEDEYEVELTHRIQSTTMDLPITWDGWFGWDVEHNSILGEWLEYSLENAIEPADELLIAHTNAAGLWWRSW